MVVLAEESARNGAHDRLGALRATPAAAQRKVRIEVLVGVLLLAVGMVMMLTLRGGRSNQPAVPSIQMPTGQDPSGESAALSVPMLLADEALVPLALEAGDFPPDLASGDAVMVTVRSDDEISGETRSLENTPTVVSVQSPTDGDVRWIIVVKAKKSLPRAIISARDVTLSVVSGGGQ